MGLPLGVQTSKFGLVVGETMVGGEGQRQQTELSRGLRCLSFLLWQLGAGIQIF